jgi:MFS family permease
MSRFMPDFSVASRLFGNRNFAKFTVGNAVLVIGPWVRRVAVEWLTWELTHSAAWLGAVGMAEFLPAIVVAPIAGVLADRFDRRCKPRGLFLCPNLGSGLAITSISAGYAFLFNTLTYLGVITALVSLNLPPHAPTRSLHASIIGEV